MNKKIINFLIQLPLGLKKSILVFLDGFIFFISIIMAFFIRLDEISFLNSSSFWLIVFSTIIINLLLLYYFNFYQAVSRFINFNIIKLLFAASVISVFIVYYLSSTFYLYLPRTVPIIYIIFSLSLIIGLRFFIKFFLNLGLLIKQKRVLIYGAGQAGRQLYSNLEVDNQYQVFAFIDDAVKLHHRQIDGKIIYPPSSLNFLLKKYTIDLILLAIPAASKEERKKILNILEIYKIRVKTVPQISEILSGKSTINKFQDVEAKDLLIRDQVLPFSNLLKSNIENNTVLITGAGGSIGSELSRQIINLKPRTIILVEMSEFALYSINTELEDTIYKENSDIKIVPLLASIKDISRMEVIFSKYKVDTVYHAAAYKHVPIIENNVIEGIKNNVFGTLNIVKLSTKYNIKSFILISTDKAVNASSIMGATKRLAELICQSEDNISNTRYSIVRFGNVLGSSGSVIPRFQEQIKNGGPVKVTSPQMTRFVMTIQEAAELVIQAGALSEDTNILILDMGEPIKILDLAKKMIHLTGQTSFIKGTNEKGDIEIIYTGLRPGEKIHEELQFNKDVKSTKHPRIMKAIEPKFDTKSLDKTLISLKEKCEINDVKKVIEVLLNSQSGYISDNNINDLTV